MYVETMPDGKKHYRPSEYVISSTWTHDRTSFVAPVIPPARILRKAEETRQPVEWNNTQRVSNCPCCEWPMRYLTEIKERKVVTYLLPGSVAPSIGWLQAAYY